jgi:hypothetical protein
VACSSWWEFFGGGYEDGEEFFFGDGFRIGLGFGDTGFGVVDRLGFGVVASHPVAKRGRQGWGTRVGLGFGVVASHPVAKRGRQGWGTRGGDVAVSNEGPVEVNGGEGSWGAGVGLVGVNVFPAHLSGAVVAGGFGAGSLAVVEAIRAGPGLAVDAERVGLAGGGQRDAHLLVEGDEGFGSEEVVFGVERGGGFLCGRRSMGRRVSSCRSPVPGGSWFRFSATHIRP